MEQAEKWQTWHCCSGGKTWRLWQIRSLFVRRVGGRMELLQTVVKNTHWKAGSDEPGLCRMETRIKNWGKKKPGLERNNSSSLPWPIWTSLQDGEKSTDGFRCTGCVPRWNMALPPWCTLWNRLLSLVGPTACCGSSNGLCWRADGPLLCCQCCCCFLCVLGQFSLPIPCLQSVVPAFQFTWPEVKW